MINEFLGKHPRLEVFIRWNYRRYAAIFRRNVSVGAKKGHKTTVVKAVPKEQLINFLSVSGIQKGDILIVHSSMSKLRQFGLSPIEVIHMVEDAVGPNGTLVIPTMPAYHEKNVWPRFAEPPSEELTYDVQRTTSWTGIITNLFLKEPGVIRSEFPYCSLAAKGPLAKEMFANELNDDLVFGPKSAWKFLSDHHAKVLFLGADAYHSITEIHLCEDLLGCEWPVKDWYKKQPFLIKRSDGSTICFEARLRKMFWSQYLCELSCIKELKDNEILFEKKLGDCPLAFIPDMNKLTSFSMDAARRNHLLLFRIPRRYL